jgi:uncharacterized protein (TIRG00374 family)
MMRPVRDRARVLGGLLISVVFLGLTLSRVDIGRTVAAVTDAAPVWLLGGTLVVVADLIVRARRWQTLLYGIEEAPERIPYRRAFGYLSIGYLANAALPARLGDVARAVLAGAAFGISRLAVFGSIVVERITDGLTMLGLAVLSSLAVAGIAELGLLTAYGVAMTAAGAIAAIVGWYVVSRSRFASTRLASTITGFVRRLSVGAGALGSTRSAATFLALTAAATTTAIVVAWAVPRSVDIQLDPPEAVLFLSAIALSLAIPAAPGSLGTYEFVGVSVLTGLGGSPEQALAAMLFMRLVATLPPVLSGFAFAIILNVRPRSIVRPVEAVEGTVAAEAQAGRIAAEGAAGTAPGRVVAGE